VWKEKKKLKLHGSCVYNKLVCLQSNYCVYNDPEAKEADPSGNSHGTQDREASTKVHGACEMGPVGPRPGKLETTYG